MDGQIVSYYKIFSDTIIVLSLCSFSNFLKIRYLSIIFIIILSFNFKSNLDYIKKSKLPNQISTKNHIYKGVVSLSKIDNFNKSCDISLITDTKIEPLIAPYAGLEAMALMSNYAFSKLKTKKSQL